jgi:hypothetical protein
MNFLEIMKAFQKARDEVTDPSLIRLCDDVEEKLVYLSYRTGELTSESRVSGVPSEGKAIGAMPRKGQASPERSHHWTEEDNLSLLDHLDSTENKDEAAVDPEIKDDFDLLFGGGSEDQPKAEEEPEEKIRPTVRPVETPSFLKDYEMSRSEGSKTKEKKKEEGNPTSAVNVSVQRAEDLRKEPTAIKEPTVKEEKELSFDDLLAESKKTADPKAEQYAKEFLGRMEEPKKEEPKETEEVEPEEIVPAEEEDQPKAPALKEEKVKYLGTFQYDQTAMVISTAKGQHDEVIATVYPLTEKKDETNCPIFVVLSLMSDSGNPVFACSYQTKNGNIIQASVGGHELMVYGEMKDHVFESKVMLTGKSMEEKETMNIVEHRAQNPDPESLGNGRILFTYDAGADVTGQIEVFPFGRNFVYIHKIESFADMRLYGQNDVAIQTADGRMMEIEIQRKDSKKNHPAGDSIVSADLVPYEAG